MQNMLYKLYVQYNFYTIYKLSIILVLCIQGISIIHILCTFRVVHTVYIYCRPCIQNAINLLDIHLTLYTYAVYTWNIMHIYKRLISYKYNTYTHYHTHITNTTQHFPLILFLYARMKKVLMLLTPSPPPPVMMQSRCL